ncbi:hypothetical protein ABK040_012268 [Willaertia magna]
MLTGLLLYVFLPLALLFFLYYYFSQQQPSKASDNLLNGNIFTKRSFLHHVKVIEDNEISPILQTFTFQEEDVKCTITINDSKNNKIIKKINEISLIELRKLQLVFKNNNCLLFIPLEEIYFIKENKENKCISIYRLNLDNTLRERIDIEFNKTISLQFYKFLSRCCKEIFYNNDDTNFTKEEDYFKKLQNHERNVLIFINPISGSGNSLNYFNNIVKPMFNDCSISYEMIQSKKANDFEEYCKTQLNLNTLNNSNKKLEIITIGGDGTLHEIINGIYLQCKEKRYSFLNILKNKIIFGVIPCGSGNAIATTLQKEMIHFIDDRKETTLVQRSTLFICKGYFSSLDLWCILQKDENVRFATVSFSFGAVADIDIKTEVIRFLGGLRYAVGVIIYAFIGSFYSCKMKYVQFKKYAEKSQNQVIRKQYDVDEKELKRNHSIVSVYDNNNENNSVTDKKEEIIISNDKINCPYMIKYFKKEVMDLGFINEIEDNNLNQILNNNEEEEVLINEPEDKLYSHIVATNISHAAADFVCSNLSFQSDGFIDLVYMHKPLSWYDLILLLANGETGSKYFDFKTYNCHKTKAIYFEPTTSGYLTVDGEKVKTKAMLVENIGNLVNVFNNRPY